MSPNNRILIIGDSTAMPRPEVPYVQTWISRLKEEYPHYDIIDRSSRGSTSFRLVTEGGYGVDLLESYAPKLVILQQGITECAPRLFKKKGLEHFFMNRVLSPARRMRYIAWVKKRRIRTPHLTDISPEDFRNNIHTYCYRAQNLGTRVLIIEIMKATDFFLEKSPHIQENINRYNDIYRETAERYSTVEILQPFDNSTDMNTLSVDELHINTEGHDILYSKIVAFLNEKGLIGP